MCPNPRRAHAASRPCVGSEHPHLRDISGQQVEICHNSMSKWGKRSRRLLTEWVLGAIPEHTQHSPEQAENSRITVPLFIGGIWPLSGAEPSRNQSPQAQPQALVPGCPCVTPAAPSHLFFPLNLGLNCCLLFDSPATSGAFLSGYGSSVLTDAPGALILCIGLCACAWLPK